MSAARVRELELWGIRKNEVGNFYLFRKDESGRPIGLGDPIATGPDVTSDAHRLRRERRTAVDENGDLIEEEVVETVTRQLRTREGKVLLDKNGEPLTKRSRSAPSSATRTATSNTS